MKIPFRALLLLGFFIGSSPQVSGEVYKWTDIEGKTHYGDTAPDQIPTTKIKVKAINQDNSSKTNQQLKEMRNNANKVQMRKQQQLNTKAAHQQSNYLKACQKAKKQLKTYSSSVYFADKHGNEFEISEKQRVKLERLSRQKVFQYCNETSSTP